jgi:transglutaminase-like putative cysteine protease
LSESPGRGAFLLDKMKALKLLLLLILILPICSAQEDWLFRSNELELKVSISSSFDIIKESDDFVLEYIKANLSFFPIDTSQQDVLSINTNHPYENIDDSAIFTWQDPKDNSIDFRIDAIIKTKNERKQIKNDVRFPLSSVPKDIMVFTQPSQTIDSENPKIIALASELAEGESALLKVIFNIAEWSKQNIEYDLSTVTAEVSQKASWVLENREGVCDELTSLFIAMLRTLGIPARFVSGISYTNSPLFQEKWGAHGWAEVYIPGTGWVPFDITYGEFGYVDPSHIVLKYSIDPQDVSTKYEWRGIDARIKTQKLNIQTTLIDHEGEIENEIEIKVDPLKDNIGFGSYNLIEADIKNLKPYFLIEEFHLSKSEGTEIIEDRFHHIILRPDERKKLFWIVKISEELNEDFIYTFPFEVYTYTNITSLTSFNSTVRNPVYTLDEIKDIRWQRTTFEKKTYSSNVNLNCALNKKEVYLYDKPSVFCKIKNIGNIALKDIIVCLKANCQKTDLAINQESDMSFPVIVTNPGIHDLNVIASNAQVSKMFGLRLDVLDNPEIAISDIQHLQKVKYEDSFKIEFTLLKRSDSNPYDITTTLTTKNTEHRWNLKEMDKHRKFIINLQGKDLKEGINTFRILSVYHDNNGKEYKTSESFTIDLVEISLWQRIKLFFISIAEIIERI